MLTVAPADGFDSYISVADADTYMAAVGYATWASLDEATKEIYLRRGSQYIGSKQLLETSIDPTVHPNVAAATCEAAERARLGKLYVDVPAQAVKSVTVGPIKRELADPSNGGQLRIPIIEDLLYGLTARGFYTGPVVLERA